MVVCRQCGAAMGPEERFCGECGTPVVDAAVPSPAEPSAPASDAVTPTEFAVPTAASALPDGSQRLPIYLGAGIAAILLVVAGAVWLGRSDDADSVVSEPVATSESGPVASETVPAETVPAETVPAASVPPAETVPPETVAPESTAPPETVAPETTAPPAPETTVSPPLVPGGWRPGEVILEAQLPPGFDASWAGSPSPAIVPGEDLADGVYWIDYESLDGPSLTLDLGRYESCDVMNDELACGPGPYGSNAIGRVQPAAGTVTLPLDDTIRVVIEGRECEPVVREGNGADLAALLDALGADYDRAFTPGLEAGGDPYDLMLAARNDPSTGFGAPPPECDDSYSLVWRMGDAPPIFVQQVVDFETGGPMDPATLLMPTAVEFAGDVATVYFYAGFFS
jgi:hypothetical protein